VVTAYLDDADSNDLEIATGGRPVLLERFGRRAGR